LPTPNRHWERPDDYDIARRIIGHVGFGSGTHQCVYQLLARLEGECASPHWRKVT